MGMLDSMSARERRLVTGLGVVFGALLLVLVPLRVGTYLSGKQEANDEERAKIAEVASARAKVAARKAALGNVAAKYQNKTPALAILVDQAAKASGLEISTQQDLQPVPRGKNYTERATKLTIPKTGLKALALFMENVENSGYPVSITALDLSRKLDPDAYVVNMTISAFDRESSPAAGATK